MGWGERKHRLERLSERTQVLVDLPVTPHITAEERTRIADYAWRAVQHQRLPRTSKREMARAIAAQAIDALELQRQALEPAKPMGRLRRWWLWLTSR